MKNLAPHIERALFASTIVTAVATALTGCGGGGDSGGATDSAVARASAPQSDFNALQIVPHEATFQGKTYSQWEASFWQWAMALPINGPIPHPFLDCQNRPISAGQSGNVWYWSAPDVPNETCDQSATVIPAGTYIFLSTLDVEASTLDTFPFQAFTADAQRQIAINFTNDIQDLFCTIDGTPVVNIRSYRTLTDQFSFFAPTPWVFNPTGAGGNGTSVGDGYFLLLKPLPPGPHTIHYGGRFHFRPGDFGHGQPLPPDVIKDTTLLITVGAG